LIVLAMVVIALMFLAWAMPSATNTILGRGSITPIMEVTEETTETIDPSSVTEAIILTNPEDVGYGDGIIIASGVLLLILLAATFREIVIYNKLIQDNVGAENDPSKEEHQNE